MSSGRQTRLGSFMGALKRNAIGDSSGNTGSCMLDHDGIETIAWRMRMLLPTSHVRVWWDWIVITLVLYNSVSIPLAIGFAYEQPTGLRVWDYIVDCIFILDVVVNFRTGFLMGDGEIELDSKKVAKRYIKGQFIIDFFASLPIDWFLVGGQASALGAVKLPRLLRLFRLIKKFDKFASARMLRVLIFVTLFLLFSHWVGCLWWTIGWTSGITGWQFQPDVVAQLLGLDTADELDQTNALYWDVDEIKREYDEHVPISRMYITSMYWALTMVMKSPWKPPKSPGEQAYCAFVVVAATLLFAMLIATVTAMVREYDKSTTVFLDKVTASHAFCASKQLAPATKQLLTNYLLENQRVSKGIVDDHIVNEFPGHIQNKVIVEVHRKVIDAALFLKECSLMGCVAFLRCLRPEVVLKGDRLVMAGTVPDRMFILTMGELQITYPPLKKQGPVTKVAHVLGEEVGGAGKAERKQSTRVPQGLIDRVGSLIGFQAPFKPQQPVIYTCRAFSRCKVLSLTRRQFADVLERHQYDAPVFMKAMDHADRQLSPDKRGSVSSSPLKQGDGSNLKTSDFRGSSGSSLTAGSDAPGQRPSCCKRPSCGGPVGPGRPAPTLDTDSPDSLFTAVNEGWLPQQNVVNQLVAASAAEDKARAVTGASSDADATAADGAAPLRESGGAAGESAEVLRARSDAVAGTRQQVADLSSEVAALSQIVLKITEQIEKGGEKDGKGSRSRIGFGGFLST